MAFQMNYTDQYKDNYPSSYWRVTQTNFNKGEKTANIVLFAYADKAHAGLRMLGAKSYNVSGADFDTYFAPGVIEPQGIDHIKQAYLLATNTLDIDSGQLDSNNNPIMVSFFNNATDI